MAQDLTTEREAGVLEECQQAIGYQFRQPDLLRAALTHTSGADTRAASNERLEFLGDSVLGLVTCEQLYHRFPDYQEGDLTKIKSAVQDLDHDLLTIEAEGNYAAAKDLLDNLGVIRPSLKKTFAKLSEIPTDIEPVFVTADSIDPPTQNAPATKKATKRSRKR